MLQVQKTINALMGAAFSATDAKFYVPVVTLSTEDDNKLLQQLKAGLRWNKCRLEIPNQPKNNNSNYLTDPTFNKVNLEKDLCYHLKMKTIERIF